jgi:hypothetical protein
VSKLSSVIIRLSLKEMFLVVHFCTEQRKKDVFRQFLLFGGHKTTSVRHYDVWSL